MVTKEQLSVELNLDTSTLGKAKRDIAEFAESGHSGFVHAGKEAKAFHKTLEKITETSPIMGRALSFALNPMAGAFTLLTVGIGAAYQALEKWNMKWDQITSKAARPIGNPAESAKAALRQIEQITKSQRDFQKAEAAKNEPGLLSNLDATQDSIAKMGPSPERDAMQRAALVKTKADLMKRGTGLDGELTKLQRDAANPRFRNGLETGKATAEALKTEIAELEAKKSSLMASADEDEKATRSNPLMRAWHGTKRLIGGEMPGEAAAQLKELEEKKKHLKQVESAHETLTRVDEHNNEMIKGKRGELTDVMSSLRDVDKQIGKLPAVPKTKTGPMYRGQPYDPEDKDTGGIKYRPLVGSLGDTLSQNEQDSFGDYYNSQTGGLQYHPIKGTPEYNDKTKLLSKQVDPLKQAQEKAMEALARLIKDGSVPVRGAN
jgi:flagellar hook-basal body complex protein FliE